MMHFSWNKNYKVCLLHEKTLNFPLVLIWVSTQTVPIPDITLHSFSPCPWYKGRYLGSILNIQIQSFYTNYVKFELCKIQTAWCRLTFKLLSPLFELLPCTNRYSSKFTRCHSCMPWPISLSKPAPLTIVYTVLVQVWTGKYACADN